MQTGMCKQGRVFLLGGDDGQASVTCCEVLAGKLRGTGGAQSTVLSGVLGVAVGSQAGSVGMLFLRPGDLIAA